MVRVNLQVQPYVHMWVPSYEFFFKLHKCKDCGKLAAISTNIAFHKQWFRDFLNQLNTIIPQFLIHHCVLLIRTFNKKFARGGSTAFHTPLFEN